MGGSCITLCPGEKSNYFEIQGRILLIRGHRLSPESFPDYLRETAMWSLLYEWSVQPSKDEEALECVSGSEKVWKLKAVFTHSYLTPHAGVQGGPTLPRPLHPAVGIPQPGTHPSV